MKDLWNIHNKTLDDESERLNMLIKANKLWQLLHWNRACLCATAITDWTELELIYYQDTENSNEKLPCDR